MDREQAIKLQELTKPCIYIGKTGYLRDKQLYIKHVKKRAAIVTSNLFSRDIQDYHEVKLENLATTDN